MFRYSFLYTIPSFLDRLQVKSTWNFTTNKFGKMYFLVNLILPWRRLTSKSVKVKFYAFKISYWKSHIDILNQYGTWQTNFARIKRNICVWFQTFSLYSRNKWNERLTPVLWNYFKIVSKCSLTSCLNAINYSFVYFLCEIFTAKF